MRKYICEGLSSYLAKDRKPWHMPGHKRKNFIDELTGEADMNMAAFLAMSTGDDEADGAEEWAFNIETILTLAASMDVTEVSGTDDLHHPEEMIHKSMEELKKVYGTYASYYMVNGSTGGILSAIGTVAKYSEEDKVGAVSGADYGANISEVACDTNSVIMARNCHKSVYNAVELFGLKPHYITPEYLTVDGEQSHIYGGINPDDVKALVEQYPDAKAVVITSPTYEGVLSDVAGIKKVLEPYNIPLIVDEAHGAHLPFISELPESAVACGADIVVQSLHKTLPSLTQTAIMHVNNPKLNDGVKKYLSIFMSSSPSYVMLCSMEHAVISAWERKNSEYGYSEYLENLKSFRQQVSNLKNIKLLGKSQESDVTPNYLDDNTFFAYDDTRIVFYSPQTGETLAQRLRELGNIEVEMSGTNYVVLISSYVDGLKDFVHLEKVIKLIDEELGNEDNSVPQNNQVYVDNTFSKEELYKLVGAMATDNIYVYPPGSYIVAAGDEITKEAVDKIIQLKASGKKIVGLKVG